MTKPILPRERDGDFDERERLLRRTKDALDAAEGGAGRQAAARDKDPITVYGAPPIPDDWDRTPAPVYGGPPPYRLDRSLAFGMPPWVLVGAVVAIALLIYFLL